MSEYWLFITSLMVIIDETVEINLDTFIDVSDHIYHTGIFFVIFSLFIHATYRLTGPP